MASPDRGSPVGGGASPLPALTAAGAGTLSPPAPGFTGVVPPPGFTGIVPRAEDGTISFKGPNLTPALVKEAVINLRQAFAAQTGNFPSSARDDKEGNGGDDASADGPPDYYGVLQLSKGAAEDAIKKAYRKLVLLWHPDKHPADRDEADDKIRQINAAYETLGNPVKREGYNQMLEAIERKKRNLRLDTTFIQPRMSIPKEFMLCPLGHPDKFVRADGNELKVMSRDDARMGFNDFFNKAKFTLWWLPEVNNMCRLRTAESAVAGNAGGMMLNFLMEGAPTVGGQLCTKDAVCVLRANEDPRYSNIIATASPFSPGAFRFEGAFWPGHYLSFRAPGSVCMAGLVDEIKDIVDFYLVDYAVAYKTMTVTEALLGPVRAHGGGDWVKLSDLRADLSVRSFFSNNLRSPVWSNREFEDFFEGHYESWEFDKKRASVRPRSQAQQLVEKLKRARSRREVAQAILRAGEELTSLPVSATEKTLRRLLGDSTEPQSGARQHMQPPPPIAGVRPGYALPVGPVGGAPAPRPGQLNITTARPPFVPPVVIGAEAALAAASAKAGAPPPPSAASEEAVGSDAAPSVSEADGSAAALRKLLGLMPALCEAAVGAVPSEVASLPEVLGLRRAIMLTPTEVEKDNDAEKDAPLTLAELRKTAAVAVAKLASARLAAGAGEKLQAATLSELLDMPLDWPACSQKLLEAVKPLLAEAKAVGAFADVLAKAAAAGSGAAPLAEAIARRELKSLNLAEGDVAARVLLVLVENGLLLREACASLREPVLSRLPLVDVVRLVAKLGEVRPLDENLRTAIETRIKPPVAGLALAKLPASDLLLLAEASTRSALIEELALEAVAGAASLFVSSWLAADLLRLVSLTARSKVACSTGSASELFSQAAQVLGPHLRQSKAPELLEAARLLAALPKGEALAQAAAKDLAGRLPELEHASLLPLTELLIPLGADCEELRTLLDRWVEVLGSKEKGLPRADAVAKLAELLAPVAPKNETVFQALGEHLEKHARHLSAAGRASLEAAFPDGGGPDFPAKASLLKAFQGKGRERSRSRDAEGGARVGSGGGGGGEPGGEGRAADTASASRGDRRKASPDERAKERSDRDRDRDRARDGRREEVEKRRRRDSAPDEDDDLADAPLRAERRRETAEAAASKRKDAGRDRREREARSRSRQRDRRRRSSSRRR